MSGEVGDARKRQTEPAGNAGTDPLAEALLDRLHGGNEVYRYESKRAANTARAHIAAMLADDATMEAVGERLLRDYSSEYNADHLTWRDFEGQARAVLATVAERLGVTL